MTETTRLHRNLLQYIVYIVNRISSSEGSSLTVRLKLVIRQPYYIIQLKDQNSHDAFGTSHLQF